MTVINQKLNQTLNPPAATAADTPQPPVTNLDPEIVIEQLRVIRSQLAEVNPLTPAQKRVLRDQSRKESDAILASSINVIGALDNVAQAIGRKPEDVRQLQTDWNRWTAVIDELRGLLNGVEGANLVRRQQLALIAQQAFVIGTQLARNPDNAVLVPHIQEVKRLKKFSRRKKTAGDPQTPTPNGTPVPSTPKVVE
ncbi:MAG TPA: hypothetical protein VH087_17810 [Thermoanaerobaculia bacterium]|nr:hypothetical protein [Thermoanaerobaculia bacterium]